jgi:hypothetical protein
VIPREGVESYNESTITASEAVGLVIPREGVERSGFKPRSIKVNLDG